MLDQLSLPIVQAPMAGGPSTPELAIAVSEAGGLGFLAAGLTTPDALRAQLAAVRAGTSRPFGVNLFVPSPSPGDPAAIAAYAAQIQPLAEAQGIALGEPRFDDGGYDALVEVVLEDVPAVVSFVFGRPSDDLVERLHAAGAQVWVTVTQVEEARAAVSAGADAVIAQGSEAGGHRGAWVDDETPQVPLLELISAVRHALDADGVPGKDGEADPAGGFPIIAAGGLMTGEHVAQAIGAGATAGQLGTAFMLTPEAGTGHAHRRAIGGPAPTAITRAFSGRRARGIVNTWMTRVGETAPRAYPEVVHLTAPLRAHGSAIRDPDLISLWAGERHADARELPAADLMRELAEELANVGGF
jgi:nitronate monooxygenase